MRQLFVTHVPKLLIYVWYKIDDPQKGFRKIISNFNMCNKKKSFTINYVCLNTEKRICCILRNKHYFKISCKYVHYFYRYICLFRILVKNQKLITHISAYGDKNPVWGVCLQICENKYFCSRIWLLITQNQY